MSSPLSVRPPESVAQFVVQAEHYWREHPDQRRGQAYFNYLYDTHPRFATDITSSDFDPFYDDAKIPDMLAAAVRLRVLS